MARAERATVVVLTPQRAFELWTDISRWPTFIEGFARADRVDESWPASGATVVWQSVPTGRGTVTEKVRVSQPGELIQTEVLEERLIGTQTVEFTPAQSTGRRRWLSAAAVGPVPRGLRACARPWCQSGAMQVSFVTADGITDHPVDAIDGLLARTDGYVWIDVPDYDAEADALLADRLHAHALVRQHCAERNFVPTVHAYEQHLFVILHAPLTGTGGHVHVLELDEIVSDRYLVTVHGPRNPIVTPEQATEETRAVRARIAAGRLRPASPHDLAYAIGSAVARRQSAAVREVASRLPAMEAKVMAADFHKPEELLEQLFLMRHELMTARTMAAQGHDIQARITFLEGYVPEEARRRASDLADQFERVRSLGDGEVQFLVGVIDLYQTRVTTKMTVAMERLAVIAAITLPVTAIASVYGMNLIVNDETHVPQLLLVLGVMLGISLTLLRWAKRQGWW